MTKKKLPIGLEDFTKLIKEGFYFVDKTYVIKELLECRGEVNLFLRPSRFGKTLTLDMFKCFFEIGQDKTLFDGLSISKETELCEKYQGKYPVIFISLKDVKGNTYDEMKAEICEIFSKEASRHAFLATSDKLWEHDKEIYRRLVELKPDDSFITSFLYELSDFLCKHYDQKVIMMIDGYDVPLAKGEQNGFFEEIGDLIFRIFMYGLKTNYAQQFSLLMGYLNIYKPGGLSGTINLIPFPTVDRRFRDAFGYTDEEVQNMLEYYNLEEHFETFKEWYGGYKFCGKHIYCPADVNDYCEDLLKDPQAKPKSYWKNHTNVDIVKTLLLKAEKEYYTTELKFFVKGKEKEIREMIKLHLTYNEIYKNIDNMWSVLFMMGYLNIEGELEKWWTTLNIPNREIRETLKEFLEDVEEQVEEED
jgi:hypothetical protein